MSIDKALKSLKQSEFVGIKAPIKVPTLNHRPCLWESMLGTVNAMNDNNEIKYFDYDYDAAAEFANISNKHDLRIYKYDKDAKWANLPNMHSFSIRNKQLVLWCEKEKSDMVNDKKINVEDMDVILSMTDSVSQKELVDIINNGENLSDYWGNGLLLYNGVDLFDFYKKNQSVLSEAAGIGREWTEEEEYDDDGEEPYTEDLKVTSEGQEVYLGYLNGKDIFISGWDIFYISDSSNYVEDNSYNCSIAFKIKDNKILILKNIEKDLLFYTKRYAYLHKTFPELIDIRLD